MPQFVDVLLVDGLKANLISISQLCDSNYTVLFSKENCKILVVNGNFVMIRKGLLIIVIQLLKTPHPTDNCYIIVQSSSSCKCQMASTFGSH